MSLIERIEALYLWRGRRCICESEFGEPVTVLLQGGPMSVGKVQAFEKLPHAADAVRLRRWEDCARRPRQRTPPLAWYVGLLEALIERQAAPSRLQVGSLSVT